MRYTFSSHVEESIADKEMVDFLLDIVVDYDKVVKPRHLKYINSYEKCNRNFKATAICHGYEEEDMLSMFWRIQRTLMLELINRVGAGQKISSDKKTPTNFSSFLKWYLEQFRDDAEEVYRMVTSKLDFKDVVFVDESKWQIDGVSDKRKSQILLVLRETSMVENLQEILPKSSYPIAKDLLNGMKLTEVCKKHNRQLTSVTKAIVGVKQGKSAADLGWIYYIEKNKEETVDHKIIEFPKKTAK